MTIFIFLIAGFLTSLILPPYFIYPLGFLIFPFLCLFLEKELPKLNKIKFFTYCFIFGLAFFGNFLVWIKNPFFIFEETKYLVVLSIFLLIFLSAIFSLIFTFIIYFNKQISPLFLVPIVFVSTEFIISNILSGFPWVTFSLIVSNIEFFSYCLRYFGTLFTSYLVLQIYCVPYYFLSNNNKLNKFFLLIIISIPLFLLIIFINLNFKPSKNNQTVSVEIFQLNKDVYLEKDNLENDMNKILDLISKSESQLLIFAENNYPYLVNDFDFNKIINKLKKNQTVIIGGTRFEDNKYFNSMFVISEDGINYFDKIELVPFGEFLPFRKFLGFFKPISGENDYVPGNKERLINQEKNFSFIPVICYEIIFYWKLIDYKNRDSDMIINITNDLWFGNFYGPYQHLYIAKIRAAEFNKFLIRVSNNGISAIINNNGKIISKTKLFEQASFKEEITLYKNQNYSIIHKYFNIYLLLLFFIFIFINIKKSNE